MSNPIDTTAKETKVYHDQACTPFRVPRPWLFFLLLASLFAAHVLLRVNMRPIPELDEGWQVALAQHWSPGYYAQPPLYTWLQILVFGVFGESIFSLALLKNGLLLALYLFVYGSAKIITRRHDYAVFTTLCLLLIPQISWECHRDLTHSVLLAATIAATVYSFLRLVERPTATRYAITGLCAGLVLVSKYNGAVFLAGGIIGALAVPQFRATLLDRRLMLAFAAAVAVAVPHFTWALSHSDQALAATNKFDSAKSLSVAALLLPRNLLKACLPNLISMFVVYVLGRRGKLAGFNSGIARILFWSCVATICLAVIGILAAKGTALRGRWFIPIFVVAPLFVIAQLNSVPRWLFRLVTSVALVVIAAVFAILPINASRGGKRSNDLTPYTVSDLETHAGDVLRSADLIVSDDLWVAGTLRLEFDKPVITPVAAHQKLTEQRVVVVYTCRRSTEPPLPLRRFLAENTGNKSLHTIHITPADNPRKIGMRLAVATLE